MNIIVDENLGDYEVVKENSSNQFFMDQNDCYGVVQKD